jgi:phosphoglycerol transferase
MKVAIQHAFPNYPLVAETELIQRFVIAFRNLGWQVAEVVTSDDIVRFRPDFVLATHYSSPKLTEFPVLGMMTNPTEYFRDSPDHIRNIRSYDGYLSGSLRISEYLTDLLFPTGKKVPITDFPFVLSVHKTEFVERPPGPYRLFYIGTRWETGRHGSLFEELSKVMPLDVYGPASRWAGVDCNYRGEIRPDGRSLLVKLRESGAALCIHSKEHRAWQLPTMRVFEAAAAGAVILADDIPFVREHFGDVILPVDADQPVEGMVEQVSEHVAWINAHPRQAAEMARQAHAIFCEKFCLERLFERLPEFVERVRQVGRYRENRRHLILQTEGSSSRGQAALARRYRHLPQAASSGFGILTAPPNILDGGDGDDSCGLTTVGCASPSLEYIICVRDTGVRHAERCLRSLAEQTYKDIGVIVVRSADVDVDEILEKHRGSFASMKVLTVPRTNVGSNALWSGLRGVTAPFFAHVEPDHRLHPNHVACLIDRLGANRGLDIVLASCVEVHNDDGPYFAQWNFNGPLGQQIPETRRLASLGMVEAEELIASADAASACSWIARRELLDAAVLEDPELTGMEAVYLCALLLTKSRAAANNWRPTCEWHVGTRVGGGKHSGDGQARSLDRVRCRLGLDKLQKPPDLKQELDGSLQQLRQEFHGHIVALHQDFLRHFQVFQLALNGHQQKLEGEVQIPLLQLVGRVHQATPPESHALHRVSQGYLALRGAWRVITQPGRLPGRLGRGVRALASQGPRKLLARLTRLD